MSSNLIRLIPMLYVITPLGEGEAHFIQVPMSDDGYAQWGCFIDETKEQWWFDNTLIRISSSISARRDGNYSPFYLDDKMMTTLLPHILRHKNSPLYEKALALTAKSD